MQIYNKLTDVFEKNNNKQFSITIGNFDGVHRGHCYILNQIKEQSLKENLIPVVLTFVPHPHEILFPDKNHYLINSYKERRDLLSKLGIDIIVEINFTRDFSTQTPESFLDNHILVSDNIKKIFVGHDFAFGSNKKGNYDFIKNYCEKQNIEVNLMNKFEFESENVSSSIIRNYITEGLIEKTNKFLDRKYHLKGTVIKGAGRGKKIGFPTANIEIPFYHIIPSLGVYVTETISNNMKFQSITNVGKNPTFNDLNKIMVETNIFDFENDIYGEEIKVHFIKKLRNEIKFNSVNDLIKQIKEDIKVSNDYFTKTN
jgi:riboflavin kinase / FMN adenylyltransferase